MVITAACKKVKVGLLVGYAFFALAITVLDREPFIGTHFQPQLLWSWSVPRLRDQIIMNVVGFMPVGFLLASTLRGICGNDRSMWLAIPLAALFSLSIELLQLVTSRGLFEFDDILHNSLGTVIGVGIFIAFRSLLSSTSVVDGVTE